MSNPAPWRPRRPEVPVQCASCPFREDNNEAFACIVNRLRKTEGLRPVKPGSKVVKTARSKIRIDLLCLGSGEFYCHGTVYNEDMTTKPISEYRQCAGATAFWRDVKGGAS